MTVALMIGSMVVGGMLAVGAAAADRLLADVGRPRRWVWAAALMGLAAWTTSAPFVAVDSEGDLTLPITVLGTESNQSPEPVEVGVPGIGERLAGLGQAIVEFEPLEPLSSLVAQSPEWLNRLLAYGWALTTALLLLALFGSFLGFRRSLGRWPIAIVDGVEAAIAPDVGPGVWGILDPRIVLPRWILDSPPSDRAIVLDHEREHQRAHDPALLACGAAIIACMPWNAPALWIYSRLRLATEVDCDARVLRRIPSRARYCEVLVEVAGRCAARPTLALVSASSNLEQRIVAMQKLRRKPSVLMVGLFIALAGASLIAACTSDLPSASEIDAMGVESAAAALEGLQLDIGADTVFTIDGEEVARDSATALPADRIESITVFRSTDDAPARVEVLTDRAGASRQSAALVPAAIADLDDPDVHLFVDGVRTDADRLRRLDRGEILSIEVLKGPAAADALERFGTDAPPGTAMIRVRTRQESTADPAAAAPTPEPSSRSNVAGPTFLPSQVAPADRPSAAGSTFLPSQVAAADTGRIAIAWSPVRAAVALAEIEEMPRESIEFANRSWESIPPQRIIDPAQIRVVGELDGATVFAESGDDPISEVTVIYRPTGRTNEFVPFRALD